MEQASTIERNRATQSFKTHRNVERINVQINVFSPGDLSARGPPDRGSALPSWPRLPALPVLLREPSPHGRAPVGTGLPPPQRDGNTPCAAVSSRSRLYAQQLQPTRNRGTCAQGPTAPWSAPLPPAIARVSPTSRWDHGLMPTGPRRLASKRRIRPKHSAGSPRGGAQRKPSQLGNVEHAEFVVRRIRPYLFIKRKRRNPNEDGERASGRLVSRTVLRERAAGPGED